MDNSFKQDILNMLMDIPYANRDRKYIMVRCPFCGDSVKNHSSTHFGVKIISSDEEPIFFHCFRCDVGGILTPHVMRMLGISDLASSSALTRYNNTAIKNNMKGFSLLDDKPVKLEMPKLIVNDRTLRKHEYLESRLGIQLDMQEMMDKKVVYSLLNLLKKNDIEHLSVKTEHAITLQEDYVGFLSARNEFINFRDITNRNKYRYYIYNILGRLDNTRKFYIMPNQIDLFTDKTITINICEGVFDVFGIYHHLYDKHEENMLYVAVCGAGFESVIKYLLKMGLTCNIDINIYSDADRNPGFYRKVLKDIEPWVNKINLYYNSIGKDYGVPKDQIALIKKRL